MNRRFACLASSLAVLTLAACSPPADHDRDAATSPAAEVGQSGPLSRDAIENSAYSPPAPDAPPTTAQNPAQPEPALIRAQILLERARFSPGAIDGLAGSNMRQAISAFQEAQGLPVTGELDADIMGRLRAVGIGAVTSTYRITQEDVAGPYIGVVPTDLEAQGEAAAMGYANIVEALAERFHVTEGLLRAMNPGADFNRVGQTLLVPAVNTTPLPAEVDHIDVNKAEGSVKAFAADGKLIAYFPATIGSGDNPTPTGTVKVNGVARNPNYTYDPSKLSFGEGSRKVVVQPGPNNPVGVVWIDLNKPSYGIHGTPDPHLVGKTASHGCVRLTNWDAWMLADKVKPGVTVRFV
ncbi:MAG: L,D-transpeptidase [Alphaproteobacteria bacterium]|uniref:L,D-transpeptidase family protein n=1 Tax=Brevundimonas sp. TaxID=1871086 RepID=UPI001D586121|nr:L,D-transpeptidase [Alphaproteobacteria bacterium]MBU1522003.1 L,D-transpeptidase [Alphaproteobacteria bacterium]MBU2029362.1 L,D-transpeptidase [Alphaproteobacteria bacterium]MBU2166028.1 L,D-transpeptidase [Alphaproteobacteria bacterium]MBU2231897.1 L,D-transpeptidase [Alphaproteobacteria bacterium]